MSGAADVMVCGESPWEIARAFPYVEVTRHSATQLEVRMQAPDGRGRAFARALERLQAEQPADDDEGRPVATEVRNALALCQLIVLVQDATGAELPSLRHYIGSQQARNRHPSSRRPAA